MNLDWIKIQPIESASKQYAYTIAEKMKQYINDEDDIEAINEQTKISESDFENGAYWVLDQLVKKLNFTKGKESLWNLVQQLKGDE